VIAAVHESAASAAAAIIVVLPLVVIASPFLFFVCRPVDGHPTLDDGNNAFASD
jgi:hypothetical protein